MQEYIGSAPPLAFAAAYAAGILVSFTPCVYPVIPITVAYIGGRSVGSRGRAFWLSLCYVLGMAAVYAGLGLFASLTGRLFGAISSHPFTLIIIANICILFGLSMFDVIRLPTVGVQQGNSKKPAGFLGAFLIGMGSGLVVGPCTTPVLGAILVYVAKQGSALYGSALLFVFALGIGTLFLLIGTFAGIAANLPKSGAWLERVKQVFGGVLILAGEYFLIEAGKRLL